MSETDLGSHRRARLSAARLYLVCDSRPGGRPLSSVLAGAIGAGVDVVQLRDKQASDGELTEVARSARQLCDRHGALFVVNDRPEVALASEADGVHLGQDDAPVEQVREIVGPDLLIGLSTHTPAEIDRAPAAVDYLGVGPVYSTPTKPGRPAVGVQLVGHASASAAVPFFAIGGITAANIALVIAAGARRVAVVRAIADAADPEEAARQLRRALDRMPLEVASAAR